MTSTQLLFAALNDYPMFREPATAAEADACLAKMASALAAGANWQEKLGPGERDAALTAATCSDERPVELLLAHGVPLDHQAGNDGTMLHRAASFGCVRVVECLLARGLAFDVKSAAGKTPLAEARAWKHGRAAVPLLMKLTAAAKKKNPTRLANGQPDARGDLEKAAVLRALRLSKEPAAALRVLRRATTAFFADSASKTVAAYLAEIGGQDDETLLPAALAAAAAAASRPPTELTVESVDSLVHVGDLIVTGDCEPRALFVTGNLTVAGRLANYEGRQVCVGGDLTADVVWTEGPLFVGGDASVKKGFVGSDNDYSAVVRGVLTTPVLVSDQHTIKAKKKICTRQFTDWEEVPAATQALLRQKRTRDRLD